MAKRNGRAEAAAVKPEHNTITLGVLSAIEADSDISQRTLSKELGVALGLANAYLRRCVRKGYVKIAEVPRRRYAYYLTPQGFAEKARLTGEYLTSSLQFFRRARQQLDVLIVECTEKGCNRIALAGASDIAEIATLTAHDHAVTLVGIVEPRWHCDRFCGLPVVAKVEALGNVDAVIITGTGNVAEIADALSSHVRRENILIPDLVQIGSLRADRKPGNGRPADAGRSIVPDKPRR